MDQKFWDWKTLIGCAALLAAATFAPSSASAQTPCTPHLGSPPLVRSGVLLGATNPTAAPLQYIDGTGKMVGLDIEFGNLIAARLCLTMQFQATEFATMIPGVRARRFDMIDSFMNYTPERAAQVKMIPYGISSLAIVVPKADTRAITGLDAFAGQHFGTQLGSVDDTLARKASDDLVKAGKKPIDVRTFANYADILQALHAGQLDGAFVGTDQAFYYRDRGQSFFRIAATGLNPHVEAIAFDDQAVADAVAQALNAAKQDGSLDALFARYHHCALPAPFKVTTGPVTPPACPVSRS